MACGLLDQPVLAGRVGRRRVSRSPRPVPPKLSCVNERIEIVPVAWDDPRAEALRAEFMADMDAIYGDTPPAYLGFFSTENVEVFGSWLALVDGEPAGHVALMSLGIPQPDALELRRLHVRPEFRRRGLARKLIDAVVEGAREQGAARLLLECGVRQPEAAALYPAYGFERIPNFPPFDRKPEQLCFGLVL